MDKNIILKTSKIGLIALETIIAGIPQIGGSLQAAIFGTLNEIRFNRLKKFAEELNERLKYLENNKKLVEEINNQIENDERFMLFLRNCIVKTYEEYDQKKFEAYKEAFIEGLVNINISVDIKLEFLKMLEKLSFLDLKVLAHLSKNESDKYECAKDIIKLLSDQSDQEKLLYLSATDTLANIQLIEIGKISINQSGFLEREKHEYRLTCLGKSFVDFIKLEM